MFKVGQKVRTDVTSTITGTFNVKEGKIYTIFTSENNFVTLEEDPNTPKYEFSEGRFSPIDVDQIKEEVKDATTKLCNDIIADEKKAEEDILKNGEPKILGLSEQLANVKDDGEVSDVVTTVTVVVGGKTYSTRNKTTSSAALIGGGAVRAFRAAAELGVAKIEEDYLEDQMRLTLSPPSES